MIKQWAEALRRHRAVVQSQTWAEFHATKGEPMTNPPPRILHPGPVPTAGLYDGQDSQARKEMGAALEASMAKLSEETREVVRRRRYDEEQVSDTRPQLVVRDGHVYGGVPVGYVDPAWLQLQGLI